MLPEFPALEPSPVVLLVENDVLKRLALASELRRRGLRVFEAAGTTEAMSVLEEACIDVVMSDVSLLEAAELVRWVRELQLPTRFMWTAGQPSHGHGDSGAPDEAHDVSPGRGAPERQETEQSATVLIVEQDVLLRLSTASSLRDAGFEVFEAANAAEAVAVLNALPVDALISDVETPDSMDGWALTKWIQNSRLNTKVILTCSDERALGEAHDHAYFLAKPYDDLSVRRVLKKALTQ